jgi:hypothetical protein
LWLVAFLQAPAAVRSPWKRLPLAVFTGLAIGETVNLPDVVRLIDTGTGITDLATLIKHLSAAIAFSALLDWVITLELPAPNARNIRWWHAAAALVLLTLVVLFFVTPRTETNDFNEAETGGLATAYLVVFEAYLAVVGMATAYRYWRAAQATQPGGLRRSILILTAGAAAGALYGTCEVVVLSVRWSGHSFPGGTVQALTAVSALLEVAAILIIVGMLAPPAASARRRARWLADYLALYPLWKSMSSAVPGIVLPRRGGPLVFVTNPEMLMIRRVAEIRDGILLMHRRVGPETITQARALLLANGSVDAGLDAAVEATAVELGLRVPYRAATAAGAQAAPVPGGSSLAEEVAWLRAVSAQRKTMTVQQAVSSLTAETLTEKTA